MTRMVACSPRLFILPAISVLVHAGCAAHQSASVPNVRAAWHRRSATSMVDDRSSAMPPAQAAPKLRRGGSLEDSSAVLAMVDGHPISRKEVTDRLLRTHGVDVLEQYIGLMAVQRAAQRLGVTLSSLDVEREHWRALNRLVDPLSTVTPGSTDRAGAQRLLATVLSQRRMSREDFDQIVRRNAYLRKIIEKEQSFTQEQLRGEYARRFGRRVQVRHIQLATTRDVQRVKDRLGRRESFATVASGYSSNMASAAAGGLLDPFSATDDDIPELFRITAFGLQPAEVSDAIRVGPWYHLIKLERVIPSEDRDFDSVRDELIASYRERATEPEMFKRFEELFRQSDVQIRDSQLREAFEQRYPWHNDSRIK